MLQLKAIAEGAADSSAATSAGARPRHREKVAWTAAVIGLLAGAAGIASLYFESPGPDPAVIQFPIDVLSTGAAAGFFAVSPDGRRVVFEASSQGTPGRSLWIRSFDSPVAQPLSGTQSAGVAGLNPFWSWDRRFVGFFADGKLKTVSISGGLRKRRRSG